MTAFITARLDERRDIASAASVATQCGDCPSWTVADGVIWTNGAGPAIVVAGSVDHGMDEAEAAHIATNDPARVLASVAVLRKIVANQRTAIDHTWQFGEEAREVTTQLAVRTLQQLAALDANHPDYDEAWAL